MLKAYIGEIAPHVGQVVRLEGWVYNYRTGGKLFFLMLRDGTGIMQCVAFKPEIGADRFAELERLTQESSVRVWGMVREDKRSPGGFELSMQGFEIVQIAEEFPITPKEHGSSFLLDNRHLWLRSKKQFAILKVRARTQKAIRDFFDSRGFTLLDTPIFTPNACEGTTTLFETEYFGDKAYLTQSGQLYNEATAAAFGKVYTFGPTFRAEKSKTRRHLTEFWMVEPEVAWAHLDDVIQLGEDLLLFIIAEVLRDCRQLLIEHLERDVSKLEAVRGPFVRIHYDDAVKLLQSKGHAFEWGGDFGAPDETIISEEHTSPIVIHHFPAAVKAFYMEPDAQDPRTCLSADFLAPEGYGEIIGGGERSANLEYLREQIRKHELPEQAFNWYLDLRRFGAFPHSGFGLGLERTVSWLCGIHHLREAIPFPRTLQRLTP
ncbi:MAG TPA: asparagine--tRNA ligase [Candidatus Krumholzibacteria bacterium]|nr:asparagine--tRNA ligase [Candidatus Krumholzibacteria bacterium]